MRTYISVIGYNSTSVTRPVLSNGIDSGDRVVLLRPRDESDDNRAAEAITDIERMLGEIEPSVETAIERVPHDDFPTAVLDCSDVIRAGTGERIVNLGGGARDVLLPLAMATLVHLNVVDSVLFFSDIDGAVRNWQLPSITMRPSEQAIRTLDEIAGFGEGASIPQLTEATGDSKSTVTRHVTALEDCNAVESWREGKTKHVRPTLTGELILRQPTDSD